MIRPLPKRVRVNVHAAGYGELRFHIRTHSSGLVRATKRLTSHHDQKPVTLGSNWILISL
ncbi:hypothetical protein M413DRAFT_437857 [Hebeloma cylindrosporum]|uniref:Uncharacterized protein n=1 Tax=Hebeloma cylindrosporum TaxID=76867 RepID=A0A0C3CX05_HEBCY|nr:hypothetical protein M413DRAFT_437857 [Hebeloma cylindrosporum h7]